MNRSLRFRRIRGTQDVVTGPSAEVTDRLFAKESDAVIWHDRMKRLQEAIDFADQMAAERMAP